VSELLFLFSVLVITETVTLTEEHLTSLHSFKSHSEPWVVLCCDIHHECDSSVSWVWLKEVSIWISVLYTRRPAQSWAAVFYLISKLVKFSYCQVFSSKVIEILKTEG